MQRFTDATPAVPAIQIRNSGRMFRLCSDGRVVGFASSYTFAEQRASELSTLFLSEAQILDESAVDESTDLTFGSRKPLCWVVEALGGAPVQIGAFQTAAEAGQFRNELEAYHRAMPESAADGEWSDAQIAWLRAHPAPMASACGGVFRIRYKGSR